MLLKVKSSYNINDFIRRWVILGIFFAVGLGAASYSFADDPAVSQQSIDVLTKINQATAEIVEAVRPAVVNISTMRTVKVQENLSPFFEDPFSESFLVTASRPRKNTRPRAWDRESSWTHADIF